MIEIENIYTKSINAISYITYFTDEYARLEESNVAGHSVFVMTATEENKKYFFEYKNKNDKNEEMIIDLVKFNNIVREYIEMSKEFNRTM